jgi:ParB-like chromosome segregation protein Spo0J
MNINLAKIRIDCGTQSRTKIDDLVVAQYSEAIKSGVIFPNVVVFHDGLEYYLADGFHRFLATKAAGSPGIACEVINGTLRDALLYSNGANGEHGLQRSNADKRNVVIRMLQDIEWSDWSDREIAKHCHVSAMLVGNIRKELGMNKEATKFERGGKTHTMKPKEKKEDEPKEEAEEDWPFEQKPEEQMADAVALLKAENEALSDRLAVATMDGDEIEKQMAESTIKDLRAQIRLLEIELAAVKQSRDTFQSENAQLMKQVASLQKKLKKQEEK